MITHHEVSRGASCAPLAVLTLDASDLPGAFDTMNPENAGNVLRSMKGNGLEGGNKWYGGITSLEGAKALITTGWAEGAERVGKLATQLAALVPTPTSTRRRNVWTDDGHTLDVDRALSGHDNPWRQSRRQSQNQPRTLRIGAGVGGNASVSADQLFYSGAQLAALADLLEQAGYRVEVVGLEAGKAGYDGASGREYVATIEAKASADALRVDRIAALFAHAGVFRTMGFAVIGNAPFCVGMALGSTIPVTPAVALAADAGVIDRIDLVMDHAYDEASALRNVRAALETLAPEALAA